MSPLGRSGPVAPLGPFERPGPLDRGRSDGLAQVPEAADYELVYRLRIPVAASFNATGVPYEIDNSTRITAPFDRVAYYVELGQPDGSVQHAWVSMTAFTTELGEIGVPARPSGQFFQRRVADMSVYSNVAGVVTGTGLAGGNIEFWSTNYGPENGAAIPGADPATYDFGDMAVPEGDYGSMQIHNPVALQTVIAYNRWGSSGGSACDLGIGSNRIPAGEGVVHADWTFRSNAADYATRTLEVLVRPGPWPIALSVTGPQARAVFQRDGGNRARIPVVGTFVGAIVRVEARAVPMPGFAGLPTAWQVLDPAPANGRFAGRLDVSAGWYRIETRVFDDDGRSETATVERVGVGEVFVTAGQSNSANSGQPPLVPRDDRVSAHGPNGWQHAADPQPIATGAGGTPWPVLGDLLAEQYDLPIGFVSVGVGGTRVDQWLPAGTLYPRLVEALTFLGPYGLRAVLWHQGESDTASGTTTDDYVARLEAIIARSRLDGGFDVPWGIALVGFYPGGDPARQAAVVAGQQRVIDRDPRVFAGPLTDDLIGADYRSDGVHFNERGLREHGRRWAEAIRALDLPAAMGRTWLPLAANQGSSGRL